MCGGQPPKSASTTTLASGIGRIAGTDADSGIAYLRLVLKGSGGGASVKPPLLVAQCTVAPDNKSRFELFASFEGDPALTFYPPWKSKGPEDPFPPRTEKATITMEFLGYTHVKPMKRQFEIPVQTPGLYRYNSSGVASSNMEDAAYFLRYLIALPTLRLTLKEQTAEFLTSAWLDQIRREPLCAASGLK